MATLPNYPIVASRTLSPYGRKTIYDGGAPGLAYTAYDRQGRSVAPVAAARQPGRWWVRCLLWLLSSLLQVAFGAAISPLM